MSISITETKVFKIYGVSVTCHTLNDGRRIVNSDSLTKLLSAMAIGIPDYSEEMDDLDGFVMWCGNKCEL